MGNIFENLVGMECFLEVVEIIKIFKKRKCELFYIYEVNWVYIESFFIKKRDYLVILIVNFIKYMRVRKK